MILLTVDANRGGDLKFKAAIESVHDNFKQYGANPSQTQKDHITEQAKKGAQQAIISLAHKSIDKLWCLQINEVIEKAIDDIVAEMNYLYTASELCLGIEYVHTVDFYSEILKDAKDSASKEIL